MARRGAAPEGAPRAVYVLVAALHLVHPVDVARVQDLLPRGERKGASPPAVAINTEMRCLRGDTGVAVAYYM